MVVDGIPVHLTRPQGRVLLELYPRDQRQQFRDTMAFARAYLERIKAAGQPVDIIQCNDWQTALIPVYLKTVYKNDPFFRNTRTVLVIHNLIFQGIFPLSWLKFIGIPEGSLPLSRIEYYGQLSLLKMGIYCADKIVFVSPSHA